MASITLHEVSKRYPDGYEAVRNVSIDIKDGEFIVLVGPSGCGKSTTLRLIAGLETVTKGKLLIDGRDVTDQSPQERDLAMVFQSYALYPHKSVRQNLAFPLQMRDVAMTEIESRVQTVAQMLRIERHLDKKPAELSGGERQRVALGRALIREPNAFLLDEPLSNLDAALREHTRYELSQIHKARKITTIYVTHDQHEAMTLGDRLVVMHKGEVQQIGDPLEVYQKPATAFVAGFIGSPSMNMLECRMTGAETAPALQAGSLTIPLPPGTKLIDSPVQVGIRPTDVGVTAPNEHSSLIIRHIEQLGASKLIYLTDEHDTIRLTAQVGSDTQVCLDERAGIRVEPERLHLFDMRGGQRMYIEHQ